MNRVPAILAVKRLAVWRSFGVFQPNYLWRWRRVFKSHIPGINLKKHYFY